MNDSRIEKLLKAILGQEVQLEPRESRVERLLYAILTSGSHDEPTLSEMEDILLCILHGERYDGPTNSRINDMLKVKANGGSYDEPRLSRIEELIYEWINGGDISTYTGTLPAVLQTVAGYLLGYKIWGNTGGVGAETENLFDESTIEVGGLSPSTGAEITNSVRRRSGFILVEPSTDYGLSREITSSGSHFWVIAYDESKNIVTDATIDASYSGVLVAGTTLTVNQWAFATTPTTRYIRWYVTNNNSYGNMMLNLGTTPLPYVPFGYKLPILSNDTTTTDIYIGDTQLAKDEYVDSETGKIYKRTENLLDETWLNDDTQLSATSGLPIAYTGRIAIINPIDVSNADTVTLSYSLGTTATEYFMYSIFSGTTLIERTAGKTSGDIINVTNADTLYICLYIGGRNITVNDVQWIMLNTGSTALPYVPYLTPTDPPVPLPQIPTAAGETTIDYGAAALPYTTGLDGIFEYGNINGLTWKNSVSGENDITFDTAVTDTGAEYVLPTGASGQYTSKSGEYRTAFTWYCIAKCPTTCHSAGQYMISDLGNGVGVEISSGWTAYSSVGGNHLVRGVDNRDFNSAEAVTSYALIVVAGDENGMASIYVNGEKKTDSWNFNPVSSSGAATVYLGKRASSQLSGTDIDYKFLALGTVKQTDAEITANSQYLMTKYLGAGRPEKVELKYR